VIAETIEFDYWDGRWHLPPVARVYYRDSWQETGFWEVLALSLAIAGITRDRGDY
jgi:hypothetical protein